MDNSKQSESAKQDAEKMDDDKQKTSSKTSSDMTKENVSACSEPSSSHSENPEVMQCACHRPKSAKSTASSSSSTSMGSKESWSIVTLAHSKAERGEVQYSEQTKKQIPIIKQLVEQQEKETAEKQARAATGEETSESNSGREPESEVSTSFAQAMDWIQSQIRRAHEEKEQKEREEYERKKERKAKKKDGNKGD